MTPRERPEDPPARGDRHRARFGDRQGPQLHLLAQADNACPCTPQTCDWRCRACRSYGRPFYSRADLQYLEHGTGPLAAELARLWQSKGAMKGHSAREGADDEIDGSRALLRGAAWLASRRRHSRTVTNLYYPGSAGPTTRA